MPTSPRFPLLFAAIPAMLFSVAAFAQQPAPAAAAAPVPAPVVAAPADAEPLDPIAKLKKELVAADDDKGTTIHLSGDVLYDFNQSNLRMEAAPTLQRLADLIRHVGKPVQISGHTDDKGNAQYNKTLSEQRAKALKAALVQRGIRPASIQATGHGKDRPRAANTNPDGTDNPAGRDANRRMDVLIVKG